MSESPLQTLNSIAQIVYDKKGVNTLALDVQGLSSLTDFLLIAEGNVNRHVSAIAHAIVSTLEEKGGETPIYTEGVQTGDWAVLDYGEIMVHIFAPGLRERYSLERLWEESKIVDLDVDTSDSQANESF